MYTLRVILPGIGFLQKKWKTSALSMTDWMVETQLCKLLGTLDTFVRRTCVFYISFITWCFVVSYLRRPFFFVFCFSFFSVFCLRCGQTARELFYLGILIMIFILWCWLLLLRPAAAVLWILRGTWSQVFLLCSSILTTLIYYVTAHSFHILLLYIIILYGGAGAAAAAAVSPLGDDVD